MDSESREPRAWIIALHSQVEGQVVFGDTKAGQLLAADSILLAALVLLANEFRNDVSTATLVLVASTAMLLGLSILIVLVAIAPAQGLLGTRSFFRNALWTTALRQEEGGAQEGSLDRFDRVADDEDYVEHGLTATADVVERSLLASIHAKAGWARHKFVWLDRAVKLAILAVLVAMVGGFVELVRWAF